ncbi:GFA family protein [Aggregicoccus sp. 17bor-14]|uniref:GFA family protein n=1 Tax=Myxococcaceae TaxID=31 RepID=UPI00129D2156|nr:MULTISPECIES: GFA family protein [Myxococcaceae]MBF5043896.1 GFA family protein [Simulacricoccus sp. 17bor-14]MRI89647.1 GFA family protein [Aggregicoccus sp. 17bor-14]
MAEDVKTDVRTYDGSCHCGAVRFRVRSPPIRTGIRCNCSICIRRGAVMSSHYVLPEDFAWVSGREALRLYQFGDHMMNHWFCGTCGIHPFGEVVEHPGKCRVNLGCLDGVDPLALEVAVIDGRSF